MTHKASSQIHTYLKPPLPPSGHAIYYHIYIYLFTHSLQLKLREDCEMKLMIYSGSVEEGMVREEDEGMLGLGLGLGLGGPTSKSGSSSSMDTDASERKCSRDRCRGRGVGFYVLFTRAQLEELSLQLLIFKYLASALLPPFHLLLPIFTSLPPSFYPSFHLLHFPLFAILQPTPCLEVGRLGLDQRYAMDQPGRCRRTDGKRWRCGKEVVRNEKYCEKHMHRGCRRSRKLVESSIEKLASSNVLNLNSVNCACPDLNTSKDPQNRKLKVQPSIAVASSNANKEKKDKDVTDQKIEDPKDRRGSDGITKIAFKLSSSAFISGKMEITEKQHKLGKDNGCGYARVKEENIVAEEKLLGAGKDDKCSNGKVEAERLKTETSKMSDTMGLKFSPKSVLQEGHSLSTVNQNNPHSVVANEMEIRRCRRTDGKRWRCRKEVIAEDQKYCAKHMHRGAKKRLVASQGGECGDTANPFALVKRANKLVVGFDSNPTS